MTRWEYKWVPFDYRSGEAPGGGHYRTVHEPAVLSDLANEHGQQGWELVSVVVSSVGLAGGWFKRPVDDRLEKRELPDPDPERVERG